MKHIKKSFLIQMSSDAFEKTENKLGLEAMDLPSKDVLKRNNGSISYMKTTKGEIIGGLVQKIGNDHYIFPVPDPTLVYFHNAQTNLIQAKKLKKNLMKSLTSEELAKNIPIHDLYNYYGFATSVIINLFTSIESFLNQQIPSDYKFERKANKCVEVFDNRQIFEFIDFNTKLKTIIPEITGKNFMAKPTPANGIIGNLKEFRDDIIHTKPKVEEPMYQDLMKKSINFNYDKAIESVATLMNFYQPNYIIQCDCGLDF